MNLSELEERLKYKKPNWIVSLWYRACRITTDFRYDVKWAWQRVKRGYDDRAVWDFHSWHARTVEGILRNLAEHKMGCPPEFWKEEDAPDQCLSWKNTLIEMADGFKAANDIDYIIFSDLDPGEREAKELELREKFERGMQLFKKHYFSLWD